MQIDWNPGIEYIVFMMYLMKSVEKGNLMEDPMEAVE